MEKNDQYYAAVLAFARQSCGSYTALAAALKATSGPAVEAWSRNGVAHKWRPALEQAFGRKYRAALRKLAQAPEVR